MVELIIDASNSTFTKKSRMVGFPIDNHMSCHVITYMYIHVVTYDYRTRVGDHVMHG